VEEAQTKCNQLDILNDFDNCKGSADSRPGESLHGIQKRAERLIRGTSYAELARMSRTIKLEAAPSDSKGKATSRKGSDENITKPIPQRGGINE